MPKHIRSLIGAGLLIALPTGVNAQQTYAPVQQQPFLRGAGVQQACSSHLCTGAATPQAIAAAQNAVPRPLANPYAGQQMHHAGQARPGHYPVATAMGPTTTTIPSHGAALQRLPRPNAQISELLQTALMQEHQGNTQAALATYQRALQINPADRRTLISAARMQHRLGNLDAAILAYQQSLRFQPNDPVVLNDLGLCLARHGDLHNALGAVSHAVRLSPNSKRYRNNLATLLVESGNLSGALMTLVQAHGPAIGHYNLACLLKRRNQKDQAVSLLNQSLNLDPSLQPAADLLAQLTAGEDRVAMLPDRSPQHQSPDELAIQNPEVLRMGNPEPTQATDQSGNIAPRNANMIAPRNANMIAPRNANVIAPRNANVIAPRSANMPVDEPANQGSQGYWQFLKKGKADPPEVESFPVSLE